MDLGERIRRQRMKSGLKSMELAEKSGLSPGSISQIERNLMNPSVSTSRKIALTGDDFKTFCIYLADLY